MIEFSVMLQLLMFCLLGLGWYSLRLLKTGTEAFVKTTAEETAKATIQELKWPGELARELQKTRGVERQELRFISYGALWKELRPLAIYDSAVINQKAAHDLSTALSNWYFSEHGGLMLTVQARDFYFALQDLLRATSKFPEDWQCDRPDEAEEAERKVFQALLRANGAEGAIAAIEYLSNRAPEDWQSKGAQLAKEWRKGINDVAKAWNRLDSGQRFATLQQVGSILRTSLVIDLESRAN